MTRIIDSPIGAIRLVAEKGAIIGLYFGSDSSGAGNTGTSGDDPVLDLCQKELEDYFAGNLRNFTTPIRMIGTDFRKQVWVALCDIPYGETASYLDIAKRIGNEKAVRAVGGANHNNPISIIVPCHRVIGTNGSLTGYGGGLDAKQFLLELENDRFGKADACFSYAKADTEAKV